MTRAISVAIVTRDYPPTAGGIPTHASELVGALRSLGTDVDVFVGSTNGCTLLTPLRRDLSEYDVVHVQSTPYALLVSHRPLVITAHSPVIEEGRFYGHLNCLKLPPAYLSERIGLLKATGVIAVSNATRTILARSYGVDPQKLCVIPNGVDLKSFFPDKNKEGHPTVLICSRLDPRKNADEALIALARIRGLPFALEVVGDGVERKRLESLAGRLGLNAIFRGEVPRDELYSSFRRADIFVSTSRSEGFDITVLEAMASGCAVVASDIPAHREILAHMRDGLLYSTHDELVSLLTRLVSRSELRDLLGSRARERAAEYSWDRVALKTHNYYMALLRQADGCR